MNTRAKVVKPKINFFWSSDGRPVKDGDKLPKKLAETTVRAVMECVDNK